MNAFCVFMSKTNLFIWFKSSLSAQSSVRLTQFGGKKPVCPIFIYMCRAVQHTLRYSLLMFPRPRTGMLH